MGNYTAFIEEEPIPSWNDYPDDESLALVFYFHGCDLNCPLCQNKQLQTPFIGKKVSISEFFSFLRLHGQKHHTNKIVLSGGDPLSKYNIDFVKEVLKENKEFDICIYTGNNIKYVKENKVNGFTFIKVGRYIEEQKVLSEKTNDYFQLASINQELYDKDYKLLTKNGRYYFGGKDV